MNQFDPQNPKPPKESTVITVMVILALIGFGALAGIVAGQMPPGHAERARQLSHLGVGSIGLGLLLAAVFVVIYWRGRK